MMHQIHEDDPEHKSFDMWEFHEAGDCRQVPNVSVFCHYTLSPTTERLILFQPPAGPGGELRAYGPEGRFIWYELPDKITNVYPLVTGVLAKMERQGKLTVYR